MKIKDILVNGIILYAAYKFGMNRGIKKNIQTEPNMVPINPIPINGYHVNSSGALSSSYVPDGDLILTQEEYDIFELINGIKNKSNKTSRDKDNLELLEIKLNQIKSRR
jgi:hypothetical protein